eukprot:6459058-Amphidinium_carterae.1
MSNQNKVRTAPRTTRNKPGRTTGQNHKPRNTEAQHGSPDQPADEEGCALVMMFRESLLTLFQLAGRAA